MGYSKISQGGLSGTVADPKVIFQVALKSNASSIILCHNHPSGNTKPSDNDIQLTKKLKKAGVNKIITTNCIEHKTNKIDVTPLLFNELKREKK